MARIEPLKLIVGEKILSGVASALRFFGRQPTDSSSVREIVPAVEEPG